MTLYNTKPGVHIRCFTNRTYINNRSVRVGTRDLLEATRTQIQNFIFHLKPVCSLLSDSSIDSGTSSMGQQLPSPDDFVAVEKSVWEVKRVSALIVPRSHKNRLGSRYWS